MVAPNQAESFLDNVLEALAHDAVQRHAALDAMPVPIYLTDPDGRVTYWNRACVDFAGREPQLGKDRWCVSWELHTLNDEPLPHDDCPMAVALREKRSVRGEIAIAMRPDGSRRAFVPYPTPLFDEDGELIGAINMLIDVSSKQVTALREQSARCRRLAGSISDQFAAQVLRDMSEGYERNAAALSRQA